MGWTIGWSASSPPSIHAYASSSATSAAAIQPMRLPFITKTRDPFRRAHAKPVRGCASPSPSIVEAAMRCATAALTPAEIGALVRRIDRPIVLVGLMGVGKSTVGRRLATILQTDFVDADEAIEEAASMQVAEIFDRFGEQYFRDGERRVIARLLDEHHGVIATGGGAFVNPDTRALILERGIAVWIDCDVATLVERTGRRDDRPLLRGGDTAEILERLNRERTPFYAQAPIRVESARGPQHETAMQIVEAVDRWL